MTLQTTPPVPQPHQASHGPTMRKEVSREVPSLCYIGHRQHGERKSPHQKHSWHRCYIWNLNFSDQAWEFSAVGSKRSDTLPPPPPPAQCRGVRLDCQATCTEKRCNRRQGSPFIQPSGHWALSVSGALGTERWAETQGPSLLELRVRATQTAKTSIANKGSKCLEKHHPWTWELIAANLIQPGESETRAHRLSLAKGCPTYFSICCHHICVHICLCRYTHTKNRFLS